jgi:hypothetical protein
MNSINGNGKDAQLEQQIERLIAAIERFTRLFDQWAGAELNARYPHGKATDRWRRRA